MAGGGTDRSIRDHLAFPVGVALFAGLAVVLLGRSFSAAQTTPSPSPPSSASASAPASPSTAVTVTPEQQAGRRLYLRDCAWCHGREGEGGAFGPTLVGVGTASADFMLTTGRMPISVPTRQPERRPTPYTTAEIRAMTAYVATFGPGPTIPSVHPEDGVLGEGADLYEENCASCHSSTGIGGAMTSGLEAPSVLDATPVQIVEAMRLGGAGYRSGNMPRFGTDAIDDHQADSIARYVGYLQHPQDRGGAPLSRIGPVVEGFVAWAVVLLALIPLIRWIGTRNPLSELDKEEEE